LAEIEDHLGVTIPQVGSDIKVPVDEFEGKVIYGQKRIGAGCIALLFLVLEIFLIVFLPFIVDQP